LWIPHSLGPVAVVPHENGPSAASPCGKVKI
jgi:hypothetical protein